MGVGGLVVWVWVVIIDAGDIMFGIEGGYRGIMEVGVRIEWVGGVVVDEKMRLMNGGNELWFGEKVWVVEMKWM